MFRDFATDFVHNAWWEVIGTLMIAIVGRVFHWTFRKKLSRKHEFWFWVIIVVCGTIGLQAVNYGLFKPFREKMSNYAPLPGPQLHCLLIQGQVMPGWAGGPVRILYQMKVVNSGGPSIAWKWKLRAEVQGQMIDANATETGMSESLFDPNTKQLSSRLDNAAYLPNSLLETPLGNGAGKSGWVVFDFPTATTDDLDRIGNKFTLTFEDCNGDMTAITNVLNQKGGGF